MRYNTVRPAVFLSRPNRFIAYADLTGSTVTCHVKNTGRCRELLLPGTTIFLEDHSEASLTTRKTRYSVIAVLKERENQPPLLINMDSQAPNQAAWEWIRQGGLAEYGAVSDLRREVVYGNSRFDLAFLLDGKPAFMEVKGVTLEDHGLAMFPDAPTERGVRHLAELSRAAAEGLSCFVFFVIQMKEITGFSPNRGTHPAFADALKAASQSGVHILAMDCAVTPDSMTVDAPVPITLN